MPEIRSWLSLFMIQTMPTMYLGPRLTSASVKVLFVNFMLSGAEVARSERIAAVLTSMIGADWHLGMRGPHVQAHVDISACVPRYLKFWLKWAPVPTLWKNVNYSKKFAPNCWHFSPFEFVIQMWIEFVRAVDTWFSPFQFVIHAMKMWASDVIAEVHQHWIFKFQLHSNGSFPEINDPFSLLGRTLWLSTHCLLRIEALKLDCTTRNEQVQMFRHQ